MPGVDNSFDIAQSNAMVDTMLQGTSGITAAAVVIGIITLFGRDRPDEHNAGKRC